MSTEIRKDGNKKGIAILLILSVAALFLRLYFAYTYKHYPETIMDWTHRIVKVGPGAFYSDEVQWPYPPLYLYILWAMGSLADLIASGDPRLWETIVMLPPIVCDVAGGILVFRVAGHYGSVRKALLLAALYLFNPAVIHNSAMWGQTDGCFTLLIALMCVSLMERRLTAAYLWYGAALLVKQQSLTFAPVLIAGFVDQVILREFSAKRLITELGKGLAVILMMILLCLPFGLKEALSQYLSVQSGMPYVSVHAYNFWALAGRNWAPLDTTFLHIPCRLWGTAAILVITILCFLISRKLGADAKKYPLLGAVLILPVFCFATAMHERYMLSGLLLLLLAYACHMPRSSIVFYLLFSLLQFANTVSVYVNALGTPRIPEHTKLMAISAGVVLSTLALYAAVAAQLRGAHCNSGEKKHRSEHVA